MLQNNNYEQSGLIHYTGKPVGSCFGGGACSPADAPRPEYRCHSISMQVARYSAIPSFKHLALQVSPKLLLLLVVCQWINKSINMVDFFFSSRSPETQWFAYLLWAKSVCVDVPASPECSAGLRNTGFDFHRKGLGATL